MPSRACSPASRPNRLLIKAPIPPAMRVGLRRSDHGMRKPVETHVKVADNEGTINLRRELVGEWRSTAWKYRGILKAIELTMIAQRKFEKSRPAPGFVRISFNGMMGSGV